jgi:hypothetical protein
MKTILIAGSAALVLAFAGCSSSSDEDAEAPSSTPPAPVETTPAPVNTSNPNDSNLSSEDAVALAAAKEDFMMSCLADTGETDEETCVVVWNCAVNEVGAQVASEAAEETKLNEALDDCSAALQ